ncbi:MAG: hypothetical protein Q7T33_10580 [Dehalococcoidia bacterium]|nr:hypothetical protein [Dehalococcoidia bacterium]
MNDKPTVTLGQEKSRRGLLALVGAGGAAALVALLGRRDGAQAGHDSTDVFHLGEDNAAVPTAVTRRTAGIDDDAALIVDNLGGIEFFRDGLYGNGSGPSSFGVLGTADSEGVVGSGGVVGVVGGSPNVGVIGLGSSLPASAEGPKDLRGLRDAASHAKAAALAGAQSGDVVAQQAESLIGVWGIGDAIGVRGDGPTAVDGIGTSVGVRGEGPIGVRGFASTATGTAVYGAVPSPSGSVGVRGHASGAGRVGVSATAVSGALALSASGRTKFSNAGRVVVSAGASSKQVTGKIVPSTALIFATLRTNPGSVDIKWIRRDSDTKFTIFLTGAAPRNLAVNYFVTN